MPQTSAARRQPEPRRAAARHHVATEPEPPIKGRIDYPAPAPDPQRTMPQDHRPPAPEPHTEAAPAPAYVPEESPPYRPRSSGLRKTLVWTVVGIIATVAILAGLTFWLEQSTTVDQSRGETSREFQMIP
ncbi:hypothetical protein GVX82_04035 [Patescibacteria group bacterium]|nr:hypothetical protein [Patescibacteria group bacterium]